MVAPQELGWKRSDIVVSTKVFWGGDGPNDKGLSRKHIIEGTRVSSAACTALKFIRQGVMHGRPRAAAMLAQLLGIGACCLWHLPSFLVLQLCLLLSIQRHCCSYHTTNVVL
jgi:hypothetical protein